MYPRDWIKGRFFCCTLFYIHLQLGMIYLAYSTFYSDNIWAFIVSTKILQMVL